jgi:hypothetical protein
LAGKIEDIEVERIFLYEENPRHEALDSQPEIIEYLCKDEQVLALARSIAAEGTNPLEIVGLVEIKSTGRSKKSYVVWEGNRRVCAIKLLNDPDLAPAHYRKDILKASEEYEPITTLPAVVFDDHDALKFWMGVIHGGQQGGIGRKDWNADQKQRHTGANRNKVALAMLDLSEKMGILAKDDRSGKLTTAQRHLNSEVVRDALGIDASDPDNIKFTVPVDEFKKQLETFIGDLKGDKVNSRNNKAQIDKYGRALAKSLSGDHAKPTPITKAAASIRKATKKAPKKLPKIPHIQYQKTMVEALTALASNKLERLHYSLCDISLDQHTPLLTIGLWAFIESLTALAGRNDTTDFVSFYSGNKITELGITGKPVALREALTRIQRNGNATKHHEISAAFDGEQLANDFDTIVPLLVKTIQAVIAKRK